MQVDGHEYIYASSEVIIAKISGETVVTDISGTVLRVVNLSGEDVSISTDVSGQVVVAEVSGQTVISKTSGQTHVGKVSGETVFIVSSGVAIDTTASGSVIYVKTSGAGVDISGATVVSKISGEVVRIVSSSGSSILTVANDSGQISTYFSSAIPFAVENVTCKFTSNAEVSEEFIVTLDSANGDVFDTILASVDPSISGAANVFVVFDPPAVLTSGDAVKVEYANSSGMGYGLRIVVRYLV